RLLGLAITAGSCMLFFPQIAKIHAAKSAQGLSLCAQLLALLGGASTAAYSYSKGFVFGQWGDSFFVTLQVIVMVMQILWYSPNKAYTFPFFSLCWAGFFAVQGGYVPMQFLMWLQAAGIPIVVVSKGLQIWECHSARSTGVLSIISVVMQLGGTIARVFTSVRRRAMLCSLVDSPSRLCSTLLSSLNSSSMVPLRRTTRRRNSRNWHPAKPRPLSPYRSFCFYRFSRYTCYLASVRSPVSYADNNKLISPDIAICMP
ncbi:mpdu-1, partial [Pristionchus pacificus]